MDFNRRRSALIEHSGLALKDGSGRRSTMTVPRSFRIDERALEVLQDEAQRRRINPSSLINQFVVAYSEYGRFAEQMGAISLSRQTFMEILNATPEGALIEAAQHAGKSAVPTFIGAMHGRVSVQTIRQLMEVLSTHAHLYEFNEMNDSY